MLFDKLLCFVLFCFASVVSWQHYPRLEGVLHRAHLLRNDMMSFVATLANYVMFEVLETTWQQLQRSLQRATDLAALVRAHETYLRSLLDRALLSSHRARRSVTPVLSALLDQVLRFSKMQEQLYASALAEAASGEQGARPTRLRQLADQYEPLLQRVDTQYRGRMLELLQRLEREGSECVSNRAANVQLCVFFLLQNEMWNKYMTGVDLAGWKSSDSSCFASITTSTTISSPLRSTRRIWYRRLEPKRGNSNRRHPERQRKIGCFEYHRCTCPRSEGGVYHELDLREGETLFYEDSNHFSFAEGTRIRR